MRESRGRRMGNTLIGFRGWEGGRNKEESSEEVERWVGGLVKGWENVVGNGRRKGEREGSGVVWEEGMEGSEREKVAGL